MTRTDPEPTESAAVFRTRERFRLATSYAELLRTAGVERGLIGPREVDRLWARHLVNSALLTELLPEHAEVLDVGSGAGLPGLPMAIRRPDLTVVLVEPMLRRTRFLTETVSELGLEDRVRVERARAEEPEVVKRLGGANWVVARAVAPLERLVRWTLPLLAPGGRLLALKGASAEQEMSEHASAVAAAGGVDVTLIALGSGADGTQVVSVTRGEDHDRVARQGRRKGR